MFTVCKRLMLVRLSETINLCVNCISIFLAIINPSEEQGIFIAGMYTPHPLRSPLLECRFKTFRSIFSIGDFLIITLAF